MRKRSGLRCGKVAALVAFVSLGACVDEPPPRSFTEFMDDNIAREGVLARCNEDREATVDELECINARRAAAAIAAIADAEQRGSLEAQSEARRLAARQRAQAQQDAARQAAEQAEADAQAEYEAQFAQADAAQADVAPVDEVNTAVVPPAPQAVDSGSTAAGTDVLAPISLPSSIRTPLTTVALPRSARQIEYTPPEPALQEITLPSRLKAQD